MQFTPTSKHINVGVEFAVHGWGAVVEVGGRCKQGQQDNFEHTRHPACARMRGRLKAQPQAAMHGNAMHGNAMQAARKGECQWNAGAATCAHVSVT